MRDATSAAVSGLKQLETCERGRELQSTMCLSITAQKKKKLHETSVYLSMEDLSYNMLQTLFEPESSLFSAVILFVPKGKSLRRSLSRLVVLFVSVNTLFEEKQIFLKPDKYSQVLFEMTELLGLCTGTVLFMCFCP